MLTENVTTEFSSYVTQVVDYLNVMKNPACLNISVQFLNTDSITQTLDKFTLSVT